MGDKLWTVKVADEITYTFDNSRRWNKYKAKLRVKDTNSSVNVGIFMQEYQMANVCWMFIGSRMAFGVLDGRYNVVDRIYCRFCKKI